MALVENSTSSHSVVSEVIPFCKTFASFYDPSLSTHKSIMASRSTLIATALTSFLAAFFNILALIAFYKNPSLRKPANIFLIALAIVDLIKSTLASPLLIALQARYLNKTQPSCVLIILFASTISLMYTQSLFLLAVLNIERFIAIKAPIWHRTHITKGILVKIAVTGCIFTSSINTIRVFTDAFVYPVLLNTLVLTVATLLFSILIWCALKKRSNQVKASNVPSLVKAQSSFSSKKPRQEQNPSLELKSKAVEKEDAKYISKIQNASSVQESQISSPSKKSVGSSKQQIHKPKEKQIIRAENEGLKNLSLHKATSSSSRKLTTGKTISSSKTHDLFPIEVNVVLKRIKSPPGIYDSDIPENIEILEENSENECLKEKETIEKHIGVMRKKQVHPGINNSPISEHIEILDNQQNDHKEKEKKSQKTKVKKMCVPTTSNRYDKAARSEKKAAKIATFLALGLFFTAVLPFVIIFAYWNFEFDHNFAMKFEPAFLLLSSLVNQATHKNSQIFLM